MEKMKLRKDRKALPAWCPPGQTPASGKESRLGVRKMGKGKKVGGRLDPPQEDPGPKVRMLLP